MTENNNALIAIAFEMRSMTSPSIHLITFLE